MAGTLQTYLVMYVTVNNSLLSQHGKATVKRSNGAQIVKTMALGFSGVSPGAPMVEIQVENSIPQAGFEFNAGTRIRGLIPAEIGLEGPGGTELKSKGFIMDDEFGQGVDQAASYSFSFVGTWADFK